MANTVGSGVPRIDESGRLVVDGTYASTAHAQTTRSLVSEGHVDSVSVAFRNVGKGKSAKRELVNGSFVVVPANPEAKVLSSKSALLLKEDASKPYGNVTYADPGYLDNEGNPVSGSDDNKPVARYPIDTEDHVRSAWSYINRRSNENNYSASQLDSIKGRIRSAAKKFGIDVDDSSDDSKAVERGDIVLKELGDLTPTQHIQAIHDASLGLGAMCVNPAERVQELVEDGVAPALAAGALFGGFNGGMFSLHDNGEDIVVKHADGTRVTLKELSSDNAPSVPAVPTPRDVAVKSVAMARQRAKIYAHNWAIDESEGSK